MNRKRRTIIGDAWADYCDKVVPRAASREQVADTRNAFYAGALSVWSGILSLLTPGVEPEPDDLLIADDVDHELREENARAQRAARRWGRPPS